MPSERVNQFQPSIFGEISKLAVQTGAVNLGQGFPDFDGPEQVKEAAIEAIRRGVNQYAVTTGAQNLKRAIARHAQRFYGQAVDAETEVVVTSGATEALFDAIQAFVDPGDEVVLFEPYYDSYLAGVQMAGGVPRYVELRVPDALHDDWWFDESELAAAVTERTALIMLNTPHNPTGKVFTSDELELIGRLAKKHDAVIVSDEVYEHLVFNPFTHVRTATVDDLADRTITISSAGKTFSLTGWKVGWAIGPSALVGAVQKAHQWVTFATASPFQEAVAHALALDDSYFSQFVSLYTAKRDRLIAGLTKAGLMPFVPRGSYFVLARTTSLKRADENDVQFCKRLIHERGVASIPPSAFYSAAHAPHVYDLARFAFCKTDEVLDRAVARLESAAVR